MRRSYRNQKKQTRLAFEPLSSSSPAKSEYSSSVQDRLASVRFNGAKQRSKNTAGPPTSVLPTPTPSSTIKTTLQSDFTWKYSRTGAHETADPSSPLSSLPTSPGLPARFRTATPSQSDHDDERDQEQDEDDMPLPSSKRRKIVDSLEGAESEHDATPARSTRRRMAGDSPQAEQSRNKDWRSSKLRSRVQTRSRKQTEENHRSVHLPSSLSGKLSDIGSPETSGDEDDIIGTQPAARRRAAKTEPDDLFVVSDEDEIEYMPSRDKQLAKTRKPRRQSTKQGVDDFLVDDDEVEYITSDEDVPVQSAKDHVDRRSPKTPRRRSRKEQAELEEDLLDLQDSDQEASARQERTRGGPVTTERDKMREHLEKLKRRRASKGAPRVIDSDDEDQEVEEYRDLEDYEAVGISNVGRDADEVQVLSDSSTELSLIGAPDTNSGENSEGGEEEDDFIVDDTQQTDVGRHGRPMNPDIPLEFTSFASAKPKELFIHIIEWLVKNKISPAFKRDDPVYNLSFTRVDDQVKAQAGSHLISAAWNADFKYALLGRPEMTVEALPGLDEDLIRTCDACNRTNHPARYDFRFSGQPYDKNTLEPLEDDEDDEDQDNDGGDDGTESTTSQQQPTSHKQEYDMQGHALRPPNTHFYLGRYCAAAAEMSHKLSHWKHHLSVSVLSYLESQNVLNSESILAREKLNKKRREREAEGIVDAMHESGVIKELWNGFQDDLEDAKWGMEGFEGKKQKGGGGPKGGRGKQRIGSVRIGGSGGGGGSSNAMNARLGEWVDGGKFRSGKSVWHDTNNGSDSDSDDG